MKISTRLKLLSSLVIKDEPMADIGADHAKLSVYLLEHKIVPFVIATELGSATATRLQRAVNASDYKEKIHLRTGDGLQVLMPGEVSTVVIAGLGGDSCAKILSNNWIKAASYKRFVIQPMTKMNVLRRSLAGEGWRIIDEQLIFENSRFFIVIVCEPGDQAYSVNALEQELGSFIPQQHDELSMIYKKLMHKKYGQIVEVLKQTETGRNADRIAYYLEVIKTLEETL